MAVRFRALRKAIARDIALGLVSPEAAERDYGVQGAHATQDVGEAKAGILPLPDGKDRNANSP